MLKNFDNILVKLLAFTKRYYTKMLVKGVLLFLCFGLLFFLMILGIEYFLWLDTTARLLLFVLFVGIELYFLFKYIVTPLFYLFKVKKGITNKEASILIGKHFSNVDDKLLNLLHLNEDTSRSELLLASIEQRSLDLSTVPFVKAVDLKDALKYVKYLAIPLLLFGIIWVSGNLNSFFSSYERVVNFDVAYEAPAPFSFVLLTPNLEVLDSETAVIKVTTRGSIRPEHVFINVLGEDRLLQENNGVYQFSFKPPLKSLDFFFKANGVASRMYTLEALSTPSIEDFELDLDYPKYTKLKSETLKSSGNAVFPEGTKVTFRIKGRSTETMHYVYNDSATAFIKKKDLFRFTKRVYDTGSYAISTSNKNVTEYEKLDYFFDVIKDAYPTISVKQVLDSSNVNTSYYVGDASDDYSIAKITLVYYVDGAFEESQRVVLDNPNIGFSRFYYTFPTGLNIQKGKRYSFYFEVEDNDAIHNGKVSKSKVFSMNILNRNQLKNKELEQQQELIDNMDKSLELFKDQKATLKELDKGQKEKKQLSFNDKSKIIDYLEKQQHQESMMQKFSKQLKENLEKTDKDDAINEMLKERLERQEIQAKKNEKLLEELSKIAYKINKEELAKRLEEVAKKQQNSERNLEQLLELTKRYYVTEKAAQLSKDLEELAKKQKLEADKENTNGKEEEQKELSNEFDKLIEDLKELSKDNDALKKPLNLDRDTNKEEEIKQDQKDAEKELEDEKNQDSDSEKKKDSGKSASKKQNSAAQKMQSMSKNLQKSSMGGGGGSSISEDADMLRQILDNLVQLSFNQELLYDDLSDDSGVSSFVSGNIRKQQELRGLFEHVDDSLFTLSLRRAELSEFVNEQITEVYYNTDKALEAFADGKIYQGVSHQKYVLAAENSLSNFLANVLDNMQQSMQSGEGQGGGQGFQLPDIIKKQGELKGKMEGKGSEGKGKSGEGKGGEGKSGEGKGKGGEEGGNVMGEGMKGLSEGGNGTAGKGGKNAGSQGGDSSGEGPSEEDLKEIYEIYKEQQIIRQTLEKQLADMINGDERKIGQKLVKQMEEFENELLNNGFTQQGMNKINNIHYEMLKLENAVLKKGKKQERESSSNTQKFSTVNTTMPASLKDSYSEIEFLERQALPLRQDFRNRVKEYFKQHD